MRLSQLTLWLCFCVSVSLQSVESQERLLPEGLAISNHLEYGHDWEVDREILENWFNLDYRYDQFTAGIRFDIFQPNDPTLTINRGKTRYAGIAFKYIGAEIGDAAEGGELTVGNYYALFGRGLILRSYEDRTIRIDNNLLGLKLGARYADVYLTALSGSMEDIASERKDILHAVDLEYRGIRWLRGGVSVATHLPEASGKARTTLAAVRLQPTLENLDLYGEYGIKLNDDITSRKLGGSEKMAGRGMYLNANAYVGAFSISAEYKMYDNYAYMASDGITSYNTPPAVQKDYSYVLLNRHPVPLDANDEEGYQVEANYSVGDRTTLNANYAVTKTLDADSYYQRVLGTTNSVRTMLRDAYAQGTHYWTSEVLTTVAFGYREERITETKSLTPILEARIGLDERHAVRVIIEHQHVTERAVDKTYTDDILVLELTRSPALSFSLLCEMVTRDAAEGGSRRTFWTFGRFGFKIGDHTDGSILVGSRQAGSICIGGICRYEPEFKGVEVKLLTRL